MAGDLAKFATIVQAIAPLHRFLVLDDAPSPEARAVGEEFQRTYAELFRRIHDYADTFVKPPLQPSVQPAAYNATGIAYSAWAAAHTKLTELWPRGMPTRMAVDPPAPRSSEGLVAPPGGLLPPPSSPSVPPPSAAPARRKRPRAEPVATVSAARDRLAPAPAPVLTTSAPGPVLSVSPPTGMAGYTFRRDPAREALLHRFEAFSPVDWSWVSSIPYARSVQDVMAARHVAVPAPPAKGKKLAGAKKDRLPLTVLDFEKRYTEYRQTIRDMVLAALARVPEEDWMPMRKHLFKNVGELSVDQVRTRDGEPLGDVHTAHRCAPR